MVNQIDSLDERILAALQAAGRLTMKALAEQVGLSSPAMIERVRRLEERGVVTGYRAIVSPAALGRPLTALVTAEVGPDHYDAFLTRVRSEPAVAECHRTTGTATHVVKVHVADTAALEQLVDDLSAAGARCSTALVLSSPVPWQEVTPPAGSTLQRSRLTRRRRRSAAEREQETPTNGNEPAPETPAKSPGRPRGRRKSAASG
ncbi:MAG: Lrp/AsnC family transcriptional regulator [Chloroflexota bacterium]|nr:Lrp/AsnC family transcriptional regulator [Chloroflexota bacterium]